MIRTIASRRPHPPAAAPATATTDKLPETSRETTDTSLRLYRVDSE
jgi:hypothetical protein